MKRELEDLVRYRLQQATESLEAAEMLLNAGKVSICINRAYYAMFYAVLAALCPRGLGTAKHSGAIGLFDREFIRAGIFPVEFSRWLHKAFDLRQLADYRDMFEASLEEAQCTLANAKAFVQQVRETVTTDMRQDPGVAANAPADHQDKGI